MLLISQNFFFKNVPVHNHKHFSTKPSLSWEQYKTFICQGLCTTAILHRHQCELSFSSECIVYKVSLFHRKQLENSKTTFLYSATFFLQHIDNAARLQNWKRTGSCALNIVTTIS